MDRRKTASIGKQKDEWTELPSQQRKEELSAKAIAGERHSCFIHYCVKSFFHIEPEGLMRSKCQQKIHSFLIEFVLGPEHF